MAEKIVSQLDADGYFIGAVAADESPREPGIYHYPQGAVDLPPPEVPAGCRAKLVGKVFVIEAMPPASPEVPPSPSAVDTADHVRADRDARMREFGWRYDRHARETRLSLPTTDSLADLDAYMQALANVPEQDGFPRDVIWPVYPPVTTPAGGAK